MTESISTHQANYPKDYTLQEKLERQLRMQAATDMVEQFSPRLRQTAFDGTRDAIESADADLRLARALAYQMAQS